MLKERSIATGGLCTWALRLANGSYVVDPSSQTSQSYDVRAAHVWFDEASATTFATLTPWIGLLGGRPVRARP